VECGGCDVLGKNYSCTLSCFPSRFKPVVLNVVDWTYPHKGRSQDIPGMLV
jgi:hypothetical protein